MYTYTHGGGVYDETGQIDAQMIDFSASINPLGMPEIAILAAANAVSASNIYPDSACRRLTVCIAEFEGSDTADILCAGGASDILFRLAYALRPKQILVAAPSFADYERAGRASGAEIVYYPLNAEDNFSVGTDITDMIHETTPGIVFICNPNNPTGTLTGLKTLEAVAAACEASGAALLIDECFLGFVRDAHLYTAKPLLRRYKNVIILKAFTKIFAMPGLRLGYAICGNHSLLDHIRFCGPDWAVSNVAQAAGIAALESADAYIENTCRYVENEREFLASGLERLGMTVYPSHTNFILFRCPEKSGLCRELRKRGILIRDCANFKGLERGFYRAAVLTREKNTRLIQAAEGVVMSWQR